MVGDLAEKSRLILNHPAAKPLGHLVVAGMSAFFLSDVTGILVDKFLPEPPPARIMGPRMSSQSIQPPDDEYAVVYSRNLFNSAGLIPGEAPPEEGGEDVERMMAVRTGLPLNLVGTLILRNSPRSIATLEDKSDTKIYPVMAGDEIPGKLRVLTVEVRKVTFINLISNKKEFIDMPEDTTLPKPIMQTTASPTPGSKIKQVSPTRFSLERSEVDGLKNNLNQILTQARAVPVFENGAPAGFKLFQIVPGSIFEKLGLHNEDVLVGVNGEPVDAAKAFNMLSQLSEINYLELNVKRGGKLMTMSYDIQ
jgi:general secretion pathway protein C